jgi:hypothetical protein
MECTSAQRWRSVPKSAVSVQPATPPLMPPRSPGEAERGSVWFGAAMRNARRSRFAKCAKTNGDPGAIRTRDPQLRRLFRESRNVLFSLRYFRILVRSRHAMRCQEMPGDAKRCQEVPRGDTVIGFAVGIEAHSRTVVDEREGPLRHSSVIRLEYAPKVWISRGGPDVPVRRTQAS